MTKRWQCEGYGALIRRVREDLGLSQQKLGEHAGYSSRTVQEVEKLATPSGRPCARIEEVLDELVRAKGHPPVPFRQHGGTRMHVARRRGWLALPTREWLAKFHGPGALLTAEYRVVPFHGETSLRERNELRNWCMEGPRHGIRIYKGEGGSGKTRLALELCILLDELREERWTAGFAQTKLLDTSDSPWVQLPCLRRPLLAVVDYAGDRDKVDMISHLLNQLAKCPAPKVRLLFLERHDLWLERLHGKVAGREIVLGPLLQRSGTTDVHKLPPVTSAGVERSQSFLAAFRIFAKKLQVAAPPPTDVGLGVRLPENVFVLHSKALLAATGVQADTRDAILRHLLAREKEYWRRRMETVGLPLHLLTAVEQAVGRISENDGAEDPKEAMAVLRRVRLLRGQPAAVLEQIVAMLRECYPSGDRGIGSLQPDMLKHYLVSRLAETE